MGRYLEVFQAVIIVLSSLLVPVVLSTYQGCYHRHHDDNATSSASSYCFESVGLNDNSSSSNSFIKNYTDAVNWCRQQGYQLLRLDEYFTLEKYEAVVEFAIDNELTSDNMWIDDCDRDHNTSQSDWKYADNGRLYNGNPCACLLDNMLT